MDNWTCSASFSWICLTKSKTYSLSRFPRSIPGQWFPLGNTLLNLQQIQVFAGFSGSKGPISQEISAKPSKLLLHSFVTQRPAAGSAHQVNPLLGPQYVCMHACMHACTYRGFIDGASPKAGWFIMKSPLNMDDLGVPSIFGKPSYNCWIFVEPWNHQPAGKDIYKQNWTRALTTHMKKWTSRCDSVTYQKSYVAVKYMQLERLGNSVAPNEYGYPQLAPSAANAPASSWVPREESIGTWWPWRACWGLPPVVVYSSWAMERQGNSCTVPFGELTVCKGKWPLIVDLSIKNGDFPYLW